MSVWPRVDLERVLSLEYGSPLKESDRDDSGRVPVAGSNGVVGHHSQALVPGPGIVVGRKGSAGKVTWFDEDFWPIDTTFYVRPAAPAHMRWTFYLLQHLQLERLSIVTGVPGLNRNDAYRLRVALPPLSEQRRVVEILDQADALRKLRAAADAKAERILPALFCKMFGDPVTNPRGWPKECLGSLGNLDRGRSQHRPRNDPGLLGGPYPFIQTGDVANARGYIRTYSTTYSELGLAQSRLWPAGTLCITIAANIGAVAILGFDACFPDSVVGFKPGPRTNAAFVRLLFHFLRPAIEQRAPQLAQKNINLEVLRGLSVPVPPTHLQDVFRGYHERLLAIDAAGTWAREHVELLWKTLLHRAFSGDLTAKWREAHMQELLAEMEQQAKALNETAPPTAPEAGVLP